MHTALHYFVVTDYYGLSVNLAALLGENTHRWYKEINYHMNHAQAEQRLLERFLANAFREAELD
jgi:hypothetical protein